LAIFRRYLGSINTLRQQRVDVIFCAFQHEVAERDQAFRVVDCDVARAPVNAAIFGFASIELDVERVLVGCCCRGGKGKLVCGFKDYEGLWRRVEERTWFWVSGVDRLCCWIIGHGPCGYSVSLVDIMAELLLDWLQVHAVWEEGTGGCVTEQVAKLVKAAVGDAHVAILLISGDLDDDGTVVAGCDGKDKSAGDNERDSEGWQWTYRVWGVPR
jgi:hypothetical protein